jgi:hypothetical protein
MNLGDAASRAVKMWSTWLNIGAVFTPSPQNYSKEMGGGGIRIDPEVQIAVAVENIIAGQVGGGIVKKALLHIHHKGQDLSTFRYEVLKGHYISGSEMQDCLADAIRQIGKETKPLLEAMDKHKEMETV